MYYNEQTPYLCVVKHKKIFFLVATKVKRKIV